MDHREASSLLVAGAGSGKTLALTHRIAHLIGEPRADPSHKTAFEMKDRLELLLAQRLAQSQCGQPWSEFIPLRAMVCPQGLRSKIAP